MANWSNRPSTASVAGGRVLMGRVVLSAGILCVTSVVCAGVAWQSGPPATGIWAGVYSEEQATRGKSRYIDACSGCHGKDLRATDGFTPPLAGGEFMYQWESRTLDELLSQLRSTMPKDRAGSLGADEYLDIVAFMLQSNGFPAGSADLRSDRNELKLLTITKKMSK